MSESAKNLSQIPIYNRTNAKQAWLLEFHATEFGAVAHCPSGPLADVVRSCAADRIDSRAAHAANGRQAKQTLDELAATQINKYYIIRSILAIVAVAVRMDPIAVLCQLRAAGVTCDAHVIIRVEFCTRTPNDKRTDCELHASKCTEETITGKFLGLFSLCLFSSFLL